MTTTTKKCKCAQGHDPFGSCARRAEVGGYCLECYDALPEGNKAVPIRLCVQCGNERHLHRREEWPYAAVCPERLCDACCPTTRRECQ